MSIMTFPFGYTDYNDALHNGKLFTPDEAKNLKDGDEAIILITHDKDDDFSLENRLFKGSVRVLSDGIDVEGYFFDFTDPDFNGPDGGGFLLHPKSESDDLKPVVIGEFSPKDKFIEFIGGSNHVNFLSKEAYIEGKQLSGLDYDGIKFKLTICDEGTVNFEEVGSNMTTSEQRGRLLELISDKTLVPYRQRWCVRELEFESVQHIKGKSIPLFLSVEYQRPIDKLASIFDEVETPEIKEDLGSKLDILMSMFGEDSSVEETEEDDVEIEVVEEVSSYQSTLEASFAKMKQEKIDEIKSRISQKEKDVRKFETDVVQSQKKVEDAKSELKLLEDRLETLQPVEPFNGYYFNVSERMNEKVDLEPEISELILSKVRKIKGINAEAFMKLFENGEYQIRLGQNQDGVLTEIMDYESLPETVRKQLAGMNIRLEPIDPSDAAMVAMGVTDVAVMRAKLKYVGELSWGEIVQKMIKLGFGQESEFDKMCGSNSFESHVERKTEDRIKKFNEASVDKDGNLVWDDNDEWDEDMEEMYGDIKDDDFIFAIHEEEDATNELGDPKIVFCVNPLSYGKNIAYDQHLEHLLKSRFPEIKALGDCFEELEEATFDIWDEKTDSHWDVEQVVDFLCKIGIKPSVKYQTHCSQKDLQLLKDTVNKLGHQNLMLD